MLKLRLADKPYVFLMHVIKNQNYKKHTFKFLHQLESK